MKDQRARLRGGGGGGGSERSVTVVGVVMVGRLRVESKRQLS